MVVIGMSQLAVPVGSWKLEVLTASSGCKATTMTPQATTHPQHHAARVKCPSSVDMPAIASFQ
jgi:hypothetical protein